MSRSGVSEVQLERLPHRHAVLRLRQAYRKLRQLEAARPKTGTDQAQKTVQEVTKE